MICSCSEGVMVFRISSRWLASSTEAAMASILSCLSSKRLQYEKDWWLNTIWNGGLTTKYCKHITVYLVCTKFVLQAWKKRILMNTYTCTCVHLLLFLSSPLHYTRPTIKIRLVIQFSADLNKIINTSKSNLDWVQLFTVLL